MFLRTIKTPLNQKPFFLEFKSLYTILREGEGRGWSSCTKTYGGHSCCNKSFQILRTSDLPGLADDAMKTIIMLHTSLFLIQLIQTGLSIVLTVFLNKSWKTPEKFILSLKLNFQVNLNLRLGNIRRANSGNSYFWCCAQLWQPKAHYLCPPKLINYTFISLRFLQENVQIGERGFVSHDINNFFKLSFTMTYLICIEKNCYKYLIHCFKNGFSDEIFKL